MSNLFLSVLEILLPSCIWCSPCSCFGKGGEQS